MRVLRVASTMTSQQQAILRKHNNYYTSSSSWKKVVVTVQYIWLTSEGYVLRLLCCMINKISGCVKEVCIGGCLCPIETRNELNQSMSEWDSSSIMIVQYLNPMSWILSWIFYCPVTNFLVLWRWNNLERMSSNYCSKCYLRPNCLLTF